MNFDFGTFVFLLVLIFLNGVFAMSEIALVVSRKAKLTVWADEGDTRAERVMKIQSDTSVFYDSGGNYFHRHFVRYCR